MMAYELIVEVEEHLSDEEIWAEAKQYFSSDELREFMEHLIAAFDLPLVTAE